MNKGRWTEKEDEFIKENSSKMDIYEIGNILNRTPSAVKLRMRYISFPEKYRENIEDNAANTKREKWILINKILNMLRKEKGLPLVSEEKNPY